MFSDVILFAIYVNMYIYINVFDVDIEVCMYVCVHIYDKWN